MTNREKIIEIYESGGMPAKIRAYLKEEIDFFDSQGPEFWDRINDECLNKKNPNNILIFHLLKITDKPSEWRHLWIMSDPLDVDVDLESEGREKAIDNLNKNYVSKRVL